MKNKNKWILLVVSIIILIILVLSPSNNKVEIKLGFIAPLTGDASDLGNGALKSALYAVDKINKEGGINGRKLVLIPEDGKCNAKDALSATNKLIGNDKIVGLIGGFCSSESVAILDILDKNKTPAISPISSSPALTKADDYFFRNYPSDAYQGVFSAKLLKEKLGKTNVAVLYSNSEWGVGVKNSFTEEFKRLGGNILTEEGYSDNTNDLKTQLIKIKELKPDVIYFVGYTNASILGLGQMKSLGMNTPVLGADAWNDPKIWKDTSYADNAEVTYTVPKSEMNEQYKKEMKSIGIEEITAGSNQAYDAVNIFAEAMKKNGTNGSKIKKYFEDNSFKNTISYNETRFDKSGDLLGADYDLYKVVNHTSEIVK